MGSKSHVRHSFGVFFAWHGLESCWCFGLFESDADETFSSHRSESTFRTVFCLAEARLLLAFGCFGTEALFVFYGFQRWREAFCLRVFCLAWARILLVFRSFRIWRWRDFEQPSFGIHVSNGFLLGRGSTAAGVRVFRNRSFVFYGFQRWREAFCLRVFCLAWARILLVFRSFRIWRWRDFEQPSFGIHVPACGYMCVSNGFLLGRGSTAAGVRVFRFLWVPKVTWSIPSACFLLGMGSHLAGVSVFSNLTLTRLSAAIVRNPRFERFFAWQRLDCCWRSGVSFFSFLCMGSKGDVKHSVCVFFAWHGLESCWCFGLFEFDADETLSSHRSESTFRTVFCLAEARLLLAFGCFVFYGFQRWREAFCLRVFCLAWARILLVFRSFRIWRWRDFEQPSFGIHVSNGFLLGRGSTAAGVRVFRNRSFVCFLWVSKVTWSILSACFLLGMGSNLAGFWSFRIWRWRDFEQPSFGIHVPACGYMCVSNGFLLGRGSTAAGVRVFRFLWVWKVTWGILSACFLLGMGSNLAGVSVFSNLTLTRLSAAIVRNPRFERFFAWQRLDCCWRSGVSEPKLCLFFMGSKGDVKHSVCVFFAWHGLESCWCFGLFESDADETLTSHRSESTFRTVFCLAEARLLLAFGCFVFYGWREAFCLRVFLLGMGSNLAGVSVFSNLTLTRLWAAIVRNPRSCLWLYVRFERFFAWQRLDCCWRSGVSFFMGSKGDVKHSVCVFFAWHGLESCWCFGLFESDADETFSSHRSESTFRTVFCLAEARLLLAFGCFGTEALFVFYGFQRWREAFCLRVFCLAWARILLVFRSFRIWRWRDFEQPSFGIHVPASACGYMCVSNGFLLGRG